MANMYECNDGFYLVQKHFLTFCGWSIIYINTTLIWLPVFQIYFWKSWIPGVIHTHHQHSVSEEDKWKWNQKDVGRILVVNFKWSRISSETLIKSNYSEVSWIQMQYFLLLIISKCTILFTRFCLFNLVMVHYKCSAISKHIYASIHTM